MRVVQLVRIGMFRISAVFLPAICATFTAYTIPESPQPALDNVWTIKVCTGPAWAQFCGIRANDEVCCLGIGTVCLGAMAGVSNPDEILFTSSYLKMIFGNAQVYLGVAYHGEAFLGMYFMHVVLYTHILKRELLLVYSCRCE